MSSCRKPLIDQGPGGGMLEVAIDPGQSIHVVSNSSDLMYVAAACLHLTVVKKVTIHQVTTMLVTSKNVLFPGHNHLLRIDTDDPTL